MMSLGAVFSGCDSTYVLTALIVLLLLFLVRCGKPKKFPPGPIGLPIVGYTPFFGNNAAETLRKMKGRYGPVMSVQMGAEHWVVLNDFHSIHEGLVKQGEFFSGRPNNFLLNLITDRCGVIFNDYGRVWKNLRKFGLMTLRGFGVGKKGMEEDIIEEIPHLIENLTKEDHESHLIKLTKSVSNIICRVTFGSRFEYEDERFTTVVNVLRELFSDNFDAKLRGLIMAAPMLRYFPIFKGTLNRTIKELDILKDILRGIIKEHRDTFDKENIRDFIDAFLVEMEHGNSKESYNEKQLLQYIIDLFEAGSGTSSSTLIWGFLALANHQDCQEKIAKEIDDEIGDSGLPTMKQREQMPYTCAFIQELMRHRTLTPLAAMHKTSEQCTIYGYNIPKNTTVIPNIWSVHYDPELFDNPEEFRPERFLDENGNFVKSNHVIPFSLGPRHCLGEQLARMEIFIFLTGIVQKLKILPDPEKPPPPLAEGSYPLLSTYEPPDFIVKLVKR